MIKIRAHGFKRPYHKLQILSWVYLFYLVSVFSLMTLTLFPNDIKLLLGILYGICLLLVFISGVRCTQSNPIDPAINEANIAKLLS